MISFEKKTYKYKTLCDYLKNCKQDTIQLSLKQIEKILGFPLPKSSAIAGWWSNTPENGHTQAHAWTDAGYRVQVSGEIRVFIKR